MRNVNGRSVTWNVCGWPKLDTLTMDPIPHAALAMELARTCGLRGVQKRASYELHGCLRSGKSSPHPPAAGVEAQETSRADVEMGLDELPRADLLRLLHAREQLVLAWAENVGWSPTDFVCPRGTQTPPENGGSSTSSSNDGHRLGCASASADRVSARWAELVHTSGLYVQQMVDPLIRPYGDPVEGRRVLQEVRGCQDEHVERAQEEAMGQPGYVAGVDRS